MRRGRGMRALLSLFLLMGTMILAEPESATAAGTTCPADRPLTQVTVSTVPVVPAATLRIGSRTVTTDAAGQATVSVCRLLSAREISGPTAAIQLPGHRRVVFDRVFLGGQGKVIQAAFGMDHEVSFSFSGLPTKQIESFVLRSSTGSVITRSSLEPVYLPGSRVLRGPDGLEQRDIYYSVDRVTVAGSNVVNRSQVRFYPDERSVVRVPLLAFDVRVEVVDRLFRNSVGSAVRLSREGVLDLRKPLVNGSATFEEAARGDYDVVAEAPGLRIDRSLILSADQVVVMPVLTWLDLAVLVGVPLLIGSGLVLAPRPHLRQRLLPPALRLQRRSARRQGQTPAQLGLRDGRSRARSRGGGG